MKVILLADVRGVGRKSEVKEVSDGYAKNVLLPKKLAQFAAPQDIQRLTEKKAAEEKQTAAEKARLLRLRDELHAKELFFKVKTGPKGEVFGSVNADMLRIALRGQGIEVERVDLPKPLKTLGAHEVPLSLGMGTKATIKTTLIPE